MRALVLLLAGCATTSAFAPPPSGCLEVVRHGYGKHSHSHLMKNGEEIPYDVVQATAADPEAQRLAVRAENESRAGLGFVAAAPALFLGAFVSGWVGTDRPKHLEPWAQVTVPTLLASEVLSIGISLGLLLGSNRTQQKAIERYNQDQGCR
jgi:hypothetical protein